MCALRPRVGERRIILKCERLNSPRIKIWNSKILQVQEKPVVWAEDNLFGIPHSEAAALREHIWFCFHQLLSKNTLM